MTLEKLKETLENTGIPVVYGAFPERTLRPFLLSVIWKLKVIIFTQMGSSTTPRKGRRLNYTLSIEVFLWSAK